MGCESVLKKYSNLVIVVNMFYNAVKMFYNRMIEEMFCSIITVLMMYCSIM